MTLLLAGLTAMSIASPQDRVSAAYRAAEGTVKTMFHSAKVEYPPSRLFIRAIKQDRQMEIWASNGPRSPFRLVKSYPIAAMSGVLGPKRMQGDGQVPEGFYYINRFNPFSAYHLSLGLSYPNKADLVRAGSDDPGGDIFIHGNRVSIGCMAMTDEKIKEIYIMALEAKKSGQTQIPVHIFPYRMDKVKVDAEPELVRFWDSLKPAYDRFEKTHFVSQVAVDRNGNYKVR